MWSFVVVEGEELVKSSEPPPLLVVGLEEPLDLPVGLWPTNLAQCVDYLILVEVSLELVVQTRSLVLVCIDELRPVVGNHLQNLPMRGIVLTHFIQQRDAPLCGATLVFDHLQHLPRRIVLNRETPLPALVLVPVHVHRHQRMVTLETNPQPAASLLVPVSGHVFGLLEDLVDEVVVDGEAVTDAQDMRDRDGTQPEFGVKRENSLFEVRRILRVGIPVWHLHLRNLTAFAIVLGELLHSPSADLELISNELCVQVMVYDSPADSFNILLVQLHLVSTI